jgi:hypothetical protein
MNDEAKLPSQVQEKIDTIGDQASKGAKAWDILTDGKIDRRDPPAAMQLAQSALIIIGAATYIALHAIEAVQKLGLLGG